MPTFYPSIPEDLQAWALAQPVFFIASAPTHGAHINVSPKGLPGRCLRVTSGNQCAYLDITGSGVETVSHLRENGRATLMWCSFGPSPRIMRWFCRGRIVEAPNDDGGGNGEGDGFAKDAASTVDPEWREWRARFGDVVGARAVIVLDVFKCQTSCGFGVPYAPGQAPGSSSSSSSNDGRRKPAEAQPANNTDADPEKNAPKLQQPQQRTSFTERPTLESFSKKLAAKRSGALPSYRAEWNARSLDGLPGLRSARRDAGYWVRLEDAVPARARSVVAALGEMFGGAGRDVKTVVDRRGAVGDKVPAASLGLLMLVVLLLGWVLGIATTWLVVRSRDGGGDLLGLQRWQI